MICPRCHAANPEQARFCAGCGVALPPPDPADSLGRQPTRDRPADPPSLGERPTRRPTARRFQAGALILGRYRVTGELGQGGMGVVYQCFDETGGIAVALKALPPELSHNSIEMEEVRDNFRLVEQLHHPHIAAVKTLEKDPATGDYYLVLELAEGTDLRRWRKQQGRPLSLAEALPLLRQVATALDYAHSRKIIHRDVKPANVMVAPAGSIKVLDFGLAAQIQTSLSRVSQVHYGTSGTGPYMAPEQWRGQFQDAATDQYALAVLAYELLAGRLPFENADPTVLQQAVLNTAPDQPPTLDGQTWAALSRGLLKDRSQRYPSCAALVESLAESRTGFQPVPASDSTEKVFASARRTGWKPVLLGALVVVALFGAAGWYWGIHQPEQRRKAELARVEFAYGSVRITSEPSGATVRTGGQTLGVSPLDIAEQRPGTVNYTLELDRHKPAALTGTVAANATLRLAAMLEKLPYPSLDKPWENTLGMKFAPVAGTEALFCVWETRVQDYRAYARANSGVDGSWENPVSEAQRVTPREDCPVVNVSWDDARAFCSWLTRKEQAEGKIGPGQSYRLPADWEWSVAVGLRENRAGTPQEKDGKIDGEYPWGREWPAPRGAGNYADATMKRVHFFPFTLCSGRAQRGPGNFADSGPVAGW